MANQFDRFIDDVVTEYAEKGEGTGGTSKILSGLTFPILTVLAVQLIKDQKYIPLVLLGALMWTKIGFFVMLAGLIYFVITEYWIGVGILVTYFIVTILSVHVGKWNVKLLLLSGKPMISPFENMTDLLLILVLECLFLAIALLAHGWLGVIFWTLFGLVALDHFGRYWFRLRPRWRQIHQPLMIRYAAAAGYEAGQAEKEKREFDFFSATKSMMKSIYPLKQDGEIDDIVYAASRKMDSFSDRDLLARTIRKRTPLVPQNTVDEILGKIGGNFQTDEGRKLIVRYAIAEIVESVFGEGERGEYLLAVIEGKAN